MGASGIGIWQLAIVLVIVLLLFGTKRLRNLGGDLGNAFKGFKNAISDDDKSMKDQQSIGTMDDQTPPDSPAESSKEKQKV